MGLQYHSRLGLAPIQARLEPLTVNENPQVVRALEGLDLVQLQSLIEEGMVKPSDHVRDTNGSGQAMSLIDVRTLRSSMSPC